VTPPKVTKCFRWVTKEHTSQHGDVKWVPGEWVKQSGELKLCENGLHGCRDPLDSLNQVWGDEWWAAEARGTVLKDDDKFCASEMRIIRRIPDALIRRFALDCAEHVYPIWEKAYPSDLRVRGCLDATKAYLDDPSPENKEAMTGAARAARAAGAARVARAAEGAAWAAGYAGAAWAAGAAAWAAGAAGAAEEKWQRQHLKELLKEAFEEASP